MEGTGGGKGDGGGKRSVVLREIFFPDSARRRPLSLSPDRRARRPHARSPAPLEPLMKIGLDVSQFYYPYFSQDSRLSSLHFFLWTEEGKKRTSLCLVF